MGATSLIKNEDDQLIQCFLKHCHRRQFTAKSTIIRQGDPSRELFYIVRGSVTVRIEDESNNELVLAHLNAGDFFGELGLFKPEARRTALIRAKSACEIAQISYERLKGTSTLFSDVLLMIAKQLASRLEKVDRKVRDLAFLDVTGRVASALLDLCEEPDAMTHPDGMLIRVTRQELGFIVGASREMVGRVLRTLEDDQVVSVSGKSIVVLKKRVAPSYPPRAEASPRAVLL